MHTDSLILRCYVRPENDYLLGVCIDLNIAVRGSSFEEVKQKMSEAIGLHFSCLNDKNFRDLFFRPAPLKFQFEYRFVCLVCQVFKIHKSYQTFCELLRPKSFQIIPCG